MSSLYYYTARSTDGLFVRGSVEAGSQADALATLRTRSLYITSLEDAATAGGSVASMLHVGPVPQKNLVAFFRAFATLVAAGVPIQRALNVTLDQSASGRLREALRAISSDIESGRSLSEAMWRRPREFSRLFVMMIRAGELGGVLDEVLERIAGVVERERTLKMRLASALAYPAIVGCAAVGLVTFLVTSIVPMFQSLYAQLHVPIPRITWLLITAGAMLRGAAVWLALGAGCAVAAAIAIRCRSSKAAAAVFARAVLRIPIAGSIARKSAAARFARLLGTLLHSGVGLVAALEAVEDAIGSEPYRRSIAALSRALSEGSGVSEPLRRSALYEPIFLQMVRVGEETGALDKMLLRVADYYDLEVETALNTLASTVEPVMILMLGFAVGFIVSAIFIPLYSLIGSIK